MENFLNHAIAPTKAHTILSMKMQHAATLLQVQIHGFQNLQMKVSGDFYQVYEISFRSIARENMFDC